MPNKPKTPIQRFRLDTDEWNAFGDATPNETDRSGVLRAFIAWYLRRPGAKLPARPRVVPALTTSEEQPHD